MKVLIPLAEGCEELEAVTMIDLLRRANIEVVTAGLAEGPVTASRGTVLVPDATLDAALREEYDMVALPGGLPGADHLDNDGRLRDLLQGMASQGRYTAAICAAPKVLLHAGLLRGKCITAYPGALDGLDLRDVTLQDDAVIVDGNVVTSRGPGTAMDFALTLIELLEGVKVRGEVEAGLMRS